MKQTVASSLKLTASPCDIEFLAQGAFNKVHVVKFPGQEKEVIARVTLPVDPKWKTLSEVATLQWVRHNTSLPVPGVFSYQADRNNAIGFEWIVMSKMPGRSLGDRWRDVSFSAKEEITRRLAVFCSETFRSQLRGIGNLYRDGDSFNVGRIVSSDFIWDNHIHAPVSRGPFQSSRDWLLARLNLEHAMDIIWRLRRLLDDFFPPPGPGSNPERTMIVHEDLSRQNILVDDHGKLTAVVDWQCVSAVPLWFACQIPPLVKSKPSDEEPVKAQYRHDEDGNVAELFCENLDNYELTQLRRVFLAEMERLQPERVDIFKSSQLQRDFDLAVSGCSDEFMMLRIRHWLDDGE
ncbi:kinase-like protein [Parathielavia hyrcaniae]|uniref:Kinase-like protein n=1 Tax=Parathielavia hyrcaniae TaxID=113614 RepID=A0AAN6PRN4_9PEZI|nr:kinase-like protein [Parathielavia hyrcaniae]